MWTAVPNGLDGNGDLRVICLASPQLSGDTAPEQLLGAYSEWKAWTTWVAQSTFDLKVELNGVVQAGTTLDKSQLQPDRWAALFTNSTPVHPFEVGDLTQQSILSYPALNVAEAIRVHYTDTIIDSALTARTKSDLMGSGLLKNIRVPEAAGGEESLLRRIDELIETQQRTDGVRALKPAAPNDLADFIALQRFHSTGTGRPLESDTGRTTPEPLDFHQIIALLMEFPLLQKQLGLVFELVVPTGTLGSGNHDLRIVPIGVSDSRTPITKATKSTTGFRPMDAGDVADNRLALQNGKFALVTMDLDGAALKLRQLAENVRRSTDGSRHFLPVLRSAGLSVVRTGKAYDQWLQFNKAKTSHSEITDSDVNLRLDASSLLRGVRWQVFEPKSGRWYSLTERQTKYHFLALGADGWEPEFREEAPLTTAVAERTYFEPTLPNHTDLYLPEAMVHWEGESLGAPRPGLSMLEPKDAPREQLVVTQPGPNDPQLNAISRVAPNSLPPLRFGRTYRMRALATYVGGAGVPLAEEAASTDFTHATKPVFYARSEPVLPPEIVPRQALTMGETVTDLVIRTEWNSAPNPYEVVERHLLPPKIGQLLGEHHGMFDESGGMKRDYVSYRTMGQRAAGTLADLSGYLHLGPGEDPANHGRWFFNTPDPLPVPWLPDLFSRSALLAGLPGMMSSKRVDFGYTGDQTNWTDVTGVRLRLVEGTGAPTDLTHGVEVKIGKGDVAEVLLSSGLSAADLELMQVWRWLSQQPTKAYFTPVSGPQWTVSTYRQLGTAGLLWQITPQQRIRLICAVRQPLVVPEFTGFLVGRSLGRTKGSLTGKLNISRKSTVAVDFRADWVDYVDRLDELGWEPMAKVARGVEMGEVPIAKAGTGMPENSYDLTELPTDDLDCEFGDTKAHFAGFTTIAKTRFAEYFPKAQPQTVSLTLGDSFIMVSDRAIEFGSEVVMQGGVTMRPRLDYFLDYEEANTGKAYIARMDDGAINPSSPVDITFRPGNCRIATLWTPVRATARPARPNPVFVLPTFGWSMKTPSNDLDLPGDVLSRRKGNGLRVYLDRPWWTSGNGEALAVLLSPSSSIEADHLKPYVTAWAPDPAYLTGSLPSVLPQPEHFPTRIPTPTAQVPLAESGHLVKFAAFNPSGVDQARKLWYVDIELSPTAAYYPFIRLALARYQPSSVSNAELSPVVVADFAQLAPDRWVTLNYPQGTTQEVSVTVVGQTYTGTGSSSMRGGNITVTVERAGPSSDPLLGWEEAGTTILPAGVEWVKDAKTVWTGAIRLPAPRGMTPMRLVVQETERFAGGERVVFTDVIPVS